MSQEDVPCKLCKKCRLIKPLTEFHRNKLLRDGHENRCKSCALARARARHAANPEIERQRQYKYRRNNVEKVRQTIKARDARRPPRKYTNVRKNQDAVKARKLVEKYVQVGKLPKVTTLPCAHCGQQACDYHHDDYGKPLVVTPLCRRCHNRVHGRSLD